MQKWKKWWNIWPKQVSLQVQYQCVLKENEDLLPCAKSIYWKWIIGADVKNNHCWRRSTHPCHEMGLPKYWWLTSEINQDSLNFQNTGIRSRLNVWKTCLWPPTTHALNIYCIHPVFKCSSCSTNAKRVSMIFTFLKSTKGEGLCQHCIKLILCPWTPMIMVE